jgi:hypothetical protein
MTSRVALRDSARFLRHRGIVLVAILAVVVKVWMTAANGRVVIGAPYDDLNFLFHAQSLLDGNWLGDYTKFTLIKGPFYPVFIASAAALHVQLYVAEALFYALACAVAVGAIEPLVRRQSLRLAVFLVLLFNPMTFEQTTHRVIRGNVMSSLTLLVLGLAIWIFLRRDRESWRLAVASAALGAALSAFLLTREEGMWILIFLAPLAVALLAASRCRTPRALFERSMPIAIVAMIVVAGSFAVSSTNLVRYGWFTTVELSSPDFTAAYGALARIVPPPSKGGAAVDPRVPIQLSAVEAAYRVSPAARELRKQFDQDGAILSRRSCEQLKICGGIAGGWFVWALRDGVASSGHYRSGTAARAFYDRLAREIDAACSANTLECTPNAHSLAPRVPLSAAPRIAVDMLRAFVPLVTFAYLDFDFQVWPSEKPVIDLFRSLTRDQLTVDGVPSADAAPMRAQRAAGAVYHVLSPTLAIAATIALLAQIALAALRRRFDQLAFVAVWIVLSSAALLALLTVIDDFSFPALIPEYMKPLYVTTLFGPLFVLATSAEVWLPGRARAGPEQSKGTAPSGGSPLVWTAVLWVVAFAVAATSLALRAGHAEPLPSIALSEAQIVQLAPSTPNGALVAFDGAMLQKNGKWIAQRLDALRVKRGSVLDIVGWAADATTMGQARGLILLVDSTRRDATPSYGQVREDVARAYHKPAMRETGFSIFLATAGLGRGRHVVRLGIVARDGARFYPSKGIVLVVE